MIDEARTPLIIAAPDAQSSDYYKTFARVAASLVPFPARTFRKAGFLSARTRKRNPTAIMRSKKNVKRFLLLMPASRKSKR